MSAKSRIVPGGGPAADTSSPVAIDIEERPENEGSTTQDAQPPQDASQEGTGAGDADMEAEEEEEDIDDDPNLLASYPIYLSNSLPSTSELQLFQYPTYPRRQPLPVPTSSRQRGLNQAIRWRKNAGWVQVELPLDLRKSVYDEEKGSEMGRGAQHLGKEIGAQRAKADESDEDEKPGKKRRKDKKGKGRAAEEEEEERNRPKRLEKIRLESDLMPNMTKYCVGVMRNHALHLTHLDRIVQLRPSMHHLDGLDQMEKEDKRNMARMAAAQTDEEESDAPEKKPPPVRNISGSAINRDGPGANEKDALMAAQNRAEAESWVELKWKDMHGGERDKREVQEVLSQQLFAKSRTRLRCVTRPADYLPHVEPE